MSLFFGFLIIVLGGISTGTACWPLKVVKENNIERYLFVGKLFGIIILPWTIMFILCDVTKVIHLIDPKQIILANTFSLMWGVANILITTCYVKIGFILTSVLTTGVNIMISTLIPLIFKGSGVFAKSPGLFSKEGIISIISVIILFIAIFFINYAQGLRDNILGKKGGGEEGLSTFKYNMYKVLALIAGFFATGVMLLNAYCGSDILDAMESVGVHSPLKSIGIWAIGMLGAAFANVGYGLFLMIKNNSFYTIMNIKETLYFLCNGFQFFMYLVLLAIGTVMVGPTGASVGGGVALSVVIASNQIIGFAFGEWKGIKGRPVKILIIGIVLLIIGIVLLTFK